MTLYKLTSLFVMAMMCTMASALVYCELSVLQPSVLLCVGILGVIAVGYFIIR